MGVRSNAAALVVLGVGYGVHQVGGGAAAGLAILGIVVASYDSYMNGYGKGVEPDE